MSYTHTQGLLTRGSNLNISDENGHVVARLSSTLGKYEPEAENARRMVACWNAFEGIPTENIERMGEAFANHCNVVVIWNAARKAGIFK